MTENKGLPPDLDARILAEAGVGVREYSLTLRLAPGGSYSDCLHIGRRIQELLDARLLESWEGKDGEGRFLPARPHAFGGGRAA